MAVSKFKSANQRGEASSDGQTAGSTGAAAVADAPRAAGPAARVYQAARQFVAFCVGHPWWTACMAVFIVTWSVELYLIQEITLVFPNELGPRFAMWAPKIRLALDVLFISMLTMALRRRWLIGITIASFFVYLGLLTYFKYFLKPLSFLTIMTTWREALQVGGFALDMFPRFPALLLLAALAVKLTALVLSRKASLPRPAAWVAATALLIGYAALSSVTLYLDPLDAILTTRGVGRLGHIRGYLGPWFAEWYYLADEKVLARALEQRKIIYDRITPLEADIPIHRRLVIIQAESLDTNILDYEVDGEPVTPFLNSLRKHSMYWRVRSPHIYASADSDFVVLNGVLGSPQENTYSLIGYPYENTTPQILAQCGFETFFFHGNSGEFYNRREPFGKMGFAGLRFQEELVRDYELRADRWGIRDKDVLRVSAQELRNATGPTCHVIITLTTHTPYTLLGPSEREIYPNPRSTVEHYINNMRYLDNCLREYITSLGPGTTVMIYSDHPTEDFAGFTCDRDVDVNKQYVPCLIYDTDQYLSELQRTRSDPRSTDGSWNLADVANYLRAQIKRSAGQQDSQNEAAPGGGPEEQEREQNAAG